MSKKKAHSSDSNGATSKGKVSTETVMLAYSNRTAAWMKLSYYERALMDAEEALHLDPQHLKSIYRKGCALHHMQQFEQARECFAMTLEHATEKEIKLTVIAHKHPSPSHSTCCVSLASQESRGEMMPVKIRSAPSHCTPYYKEIPPSAVTPHSPSTPLQQGMLL
jgi:tetratricopeptide (TPR) repeat protein